VLGRKWSGARKHTVAAVLYERQCAEEANLGQQMPIGGRNWNWARIWRVWGRLAAA